MQDSGDVSNISRGVMTSLSGKFVMLVISILFLILIAALIVFDVQVQKVSASKISRVNKELVYSTIYQEWKNKNQSEAQLIANRVGHLMSTHDDAGIRILVKALADTGINYVQVINQNGTIVVTYYKNKIIEAKVHTLGLSASEGSKSVMPISLSELSTKLGLSIVSVPISYDQKSLGVVQVGYDTKSMEDILVFINSQMTINFVDAVNSLQRWMIIFLMVILLIIVGTGVYIGRDVESSLKKLLAGTKEISTGNLSHQLDLKSRDEMQIIADSLNKMTHELREKTVSKAYLDNIIESMANMLIVLNPDFTIKSVNHSTMDALNYKLNDLVGQPFEKFVKTPDSVGEMRKRFLIDEFKKNFMLHNVETFYVKKSGDFLPVLFTSSVIYNEKKQLESIICIAEDITKQKQAEKKLSHLAHFDYLTNLPNRLQFEKTLNQMFTNAMRHKQKLALLYVDLDDFKKVNDSLGHDHGDMLLVKIGERLMSSVREQDFLARLGGDEFGIILPDIHMSETAGVVANKLLNVLSNPFYINESCLHITASIGIATYPESARNTATLIRNADVALYRAKQSGRNAYQYFSKQLYRRQQEIRKIETALYTAVQHNELKLAYQPLWDIKKNKIVGAEALLRWTHPQLGEVKPDVFVPIAETMGLIVPIGDWVLKTAFSQIKKWNEKIPEEMVSIAINLSPVQLQTVDVIQRISKVMMEYQIDPKQITFELTETAVMNQVEEYEDLFKELSLLGFSVAIDDFGTGYSSLSHLKKLPIRALKIDKSFIKEIPDNENDVIIVRSIILLAKNLGLNVIAEGVEKQEQVDFLLNNGCEMAQGYFFCESVTAEEMEALLVAHKRKL